MNKKTTIGVSILIMILFLAIFAPILAKYNPNEVDLASRLLEPSTEHLLGTDNLGRDVFARTLYGARVSVFVALSVLSISVSVGVLFGLIAGYLGGIVDEVIMGIVDIILAFPDMILILAIAGMLGPSVINSIICMSLVSWVGYARTTRAIVISIKEKDFVKVSITCGSPHWYIVLKHILPNIINPIIVLAATSIGFIVLKIATLSFLGLGVQPPIAEWGAMLNEGRGYLHNASWMMIGPGVALTLFVVGCNLVGEGTSEGD